MNCNQGRTCQNDPSAICTCEDFEATQLQALGMAFFAVLLVVLCAAAVFILPLVAA